MRPGRIAPGRVAMITADWSSDMTSISHPPPRSEDQLTLDFSPAADSPGVDRAAENADSWFRDCFWRGVEEMAARGVEFEAADLVDLGVPEPDHPNRWGALMRAAHKRGLIKPVGYKQSRRAARAGGVTRTWVGVA